MKIKSIPIVWLRVIIFILISLYSIVVFGQQSPDGGQETGKPLFRVYPTISSYDHRLDFIAEKAQPAVVKWFDISGRLVYREELFLEKGANSFSIQNQGKLGKGNYILSVVIDGSRRSGRVMVM